MKKITYLIIFVLFLSNLSAQDFGYWKKHNPQNQAPIKHQVWDSFLKKYKKINLGDLILNTGAVRLEGTSSHYVPIEYPAIADFELTQSLRQAAQKLQIPLHLGIGISSDTFWAGQERYDGYSGSVLRKFQGSLEEWQKLGLLNFEMEASALFTICSVFKLQAASICCVIAKRTKSEKVDKSKYQKGIERIMKIIQEAIKDLL